MAATVTIMHTPKQPQNKNNNKYTPLYTFTRDIYILYTCCGRASVCVHLSFTTTNVA